MIRARLALLTALALSACDEAPPVDTAARPIAPPARGSPGPAGLPPRPAPSPEAAASADEPSGPDLRDVFTLGEAVERARREPTQRAAAEERLSRSAQRFPSWGRPALGRARLALFAATSGLRTEAAPGSLAAAEKALQEARAAPPAKDDEALPGELAATAALLALISDAPIPAAPAGDDGGARLARALATSGPERLGALAAVRDDGRLDAHLRLDAALALRRLSTGAARDAATAAAALLAPDFEELRVDHAELLFSSGRLDEACAALDATLASPPAPARATPLAVKAFRAAFQKLEQEKGLAHAGDPIKRVVALAPADPDAHVDLGRYWVRVGQVTTNADFFRDAKLSFETALRLAPGHARAKRELGNLGNARFVHDEHHDHEEGDGHDH